MMMSPGTHHACAPAEMFQASQLDHLPNFTRCAKTAVLIANTWNVRSMEDSEGPIEVASQQYDDQRVEG